MSMYYFKGKSNKSPLGNILVIEIPNHRVAVDLIGPVAPKSDKKNQSILTLIEYATRFPETVALNLHIPRELRKSW